MMNNERGRPALGGPDRPKAYRGREATFNCEPSVLILFRVPIVKRA